MKLGKFAAVTGATVVLVTAGGVGGATAGSLVTSSQIKNNTVHTVDIKDGTIKVADLDERVKDLLASRKVVKVGSGGAGTNVTTKISGYEIVNGAQFDPATQNSPYVTLTAECGKGKQVVGGGLVRDDDQNYHHYNWITASYASSPTTWTVRVMNDHGEMNQVTNAQAICVDGDAPAME